MRQILAGLGIVGITTVTAACNAQMVLTRQVEARRLGSELQMQFSKAADAANRSVMAETDDGAVAAARESDEAARSVLHDVEALHAVLKSMGYSEELQILEGFSARFAEYQKLDAEILPLAVENTNVKAQRLSFGASRDAVGAFRTALDAAVKVARPTEAARAEALAAQTTIAVLEIQSAQAPHIAESEDAEMTRIEEQMKALEAAARKRLEQLTSLLPRESRPQLGVATMALNRFEAINKEIVALSRRNSDVRSLALTLGRKRTVIAQCDDQLRELRETLAKHEMNATR